MAGSSAGRGEATRGREAVSAPRGSDIWVVGGVAAGRVAVWERVVIRVARAGRAA